MTKFQLMQINARLATENSELRAMIGELKLDLQIVQENKPTMLREQVCLFMDLADPIHRVRTL